MVIFEYHWKWNYQIKLKLSKQYKIIQISSRHSATFNVIILCSARERWAWYDTFDIRGQSIKFN